MLPRVARPATGLGLDLDIDLPDAATAKLRDVFAAVDKVDAPRIKRARVTGPRWIRKNVSEADALAHEQRLRLVPVRGEPTLCAAPLEWALEEVEVELRDDDGVLATFEVGLDNTTLDCRTDADGAFKAKISEEAVEVLRSALGDAKPTPERCLQGLREPTTTATPFPNDSTAFALPDWFAEIALRFFSQSLRLQVVVKASLRTPAVRPLCLDVCHAFRAVVRGEPIVRIACPLHSSVVDCICCAHEPFKARPPRPKKIVVAFEFCGEPCGSCCAGCPRHANAPTPANWLAARTCSARRRLTMRCIHTDQNGANMITSSIRLPADEPFLGVLAGAAMALIDEDSDVEPDEARKALVAEFHNERLRARMRNGVGDEEMLMRDEIASEMLLAGSYYFGPTPARPRGGCDLRQRNSSAAPATFLRDTARSHGHLLPQA
jgi:hypothetical protein